MTEQRDAARLDAETQGYRAAAEIAGWVADIMAAQRILAEKYPQKVDKAVVEMCLTIVERYLHASQGK